jgi:hypothetical protein
LQVIDSLAMMAPPSLTPSLTPLPTPSATSNLYIDWFVENSFYGIKFVNGPMEYFTNASISKNILTCYDRSLIGTEEYAEKCPTKHIRWHHGDLRNFGDIYYKDKSIDPKTKYYIAENQPFEIVFNNTVNYHFNKIRKTYPDKNHKIDTFGNRIFTLLEFGEILAHFGDSFDLRNLLKYYFSRIFDEKNNPNSILGKEMRKQNIYYFQDINNWVDFYLNYLAIDSSLLIQEHKLDFINDIKSILNGTMLCCDSDRLQAVFMRFKDILIEMYTILRIFKRNSDDDGKHNQSALSLVYMGNIHISNIKKILLEEFALYTLEKSIIGEGDNLRCLDFSSFRLDLTEELTNRNSHII